MAKLSLKPSLLAGLHAMVNGEEGAEAKIDALLLEGKGGGGDDGDGLNVPFAKERDTFIVEMERHVEDAKRDIEQLNRLVTDASEMFR